MNDGAEHSADARVRGVLLPMVEQIDPALVPELFWRIVATRPSTGDPRSVRRVIVQCVGYASGLVRSRCGRGVV